MRSRFSGVGVALVTPFLDDHSVDYYGLERLLNHVMNDGVDFLTVNGTTAEASTLTPKEKADILEFVGKKLDGHMPILYGIGANDTRHVQHLIDTTDFSFVEGILTVAPYYNKPSQRGIIAHYEAVANHAPVPVCMYNVPGRTGSNMAASTTIELASHPNIFGIKEASGDLTQCLEIIQGKPNDFMLISGDDLLTVPMISIGAKGVISVLANAFPAQFGHTIHHAISGDFVKATEGILPYLSLNKMLYDESNPVGIKEVLRFMGLCQNEVRLPLLPASDELSRDISGALTPFMAQKA